jgi:hypothetical protein
MFLVCTPNLRRLIVISHPFPAHPCQGIIFTSKHAVIWFVDEWANFLERIGRGESSEDDFKDTPSDNLELRFWVSYRGQTLARTGWFVLSFFFVRVRLSSRNNDAQCLHYFSFAIAI